MIEMKVENGRTRSSADGKVIDLIAEFSLGCGTVLHKILEDAPDETIREIMIKVFFEGVLMAMKGEGGEE